jgi:site-specific DNA recombinase
MQARAGIYVRISQDREGAGLGVERQAQDCQQLAESLGWTVGQIYTDNDVSAYSGKKRPAYTALLADLEDGAIGGVIAWHPDRLHRSPTELEHYIDLAERRSVETHTVQAGRWDLSTPSGRAVARTLGAWARYESEHKGERIKRARQQQAVAGGFHGGIRPYGYEADGMTVREDEAAEIAKAVESVIAGVSLRSLVRDLNDRKIPTSTGRAKWSSAALRDTIMRPRTAGLSSYRGEVVGAAQWPAVVAEGQWRAACAILSNPDRRTTPRGGTVKWLGSGLYICGVCGERKLRVGTNGKGGKRPSYRCSNRDSSITTGHVTREAGALDGYVESLIVTRLSEPGLLASLLPVSDGIDASALHLEQVALRERLDELASLFAAGTITTSQLATGTGKLRIRSDEIGEQLAGVATRGPLVALAETDDLDHLWYGAKSDHSDGLPLGNRRALLSALLDVTVLPARRGQRVGGLYFDPDYVRVEWKAGQK